MRSPILLKSTYFLTVLCLLVTISDTLVALEDCNFPAIYNFGDSNSDTGAFSATIIRLPYPNGETYFHAQSGRLSDGRLIIDFLANNLSLPFLSAYGDSIGANYTHGANFAVAGSSILPISEPMANTGLIPIYLTIQLLQYKQFQPRSQAVRDRGGVFMNILPKKETFSQALYTIDIGQNDLGQAILNGSTLDQIYSMVPKLVTTVSLKINVLYLLGARSFWVHNTGPLGYLAYILSGVTVAPNQKDTAGCAKQYNDVAQNFNQKLKEQIALLRVELKLAAITYVDIYSIKYSFFSQPQQYGFVKPLIVCCGTGGLYNYNADIPCGVAQSCLSPSTKVSWDGVHYTEAANKIVFDKISSGNFSDPPRKPRTACRGLL